MRILIITQSNEPTASALRFASQIVSRAGEPATILTVIEHERQRPQAGETLARGHQILGVENTQTKVRVGKQAQEIILEAEGGSYNLIIAGDKLNHPKGTSFFANPAFWLVEHAPCPVVIVKDAVEPIRHILLCDSGAKSPSELSFFTAQLVELLEAEEEVAVLHVMSQMSAGPGVRGKQLRAHAEELIKEHTHEGEILKQDMRILKSSGVRARPKVRHGQVVDEILNEIKSGNYNLLVIGAQQKRGWRGLLLDDLAKKILRKVDIPVLVVKQVLDKPDHERSGSPGVGIKEVKKK
ncbi:MAG: universal stress protein [Chloroflexota bacterium]|nr:universal stress protein [Chloroflexota bacterium]